MQAQATTTDSGIDRSILDELIAAVRCPVLLPGSSDYDQARALHNGLIERRPAVIVQCGGVADVVACVNVARERGLLLSVKGGGHNVAGNAVNDGGIVIDLARMTSVRVDPLARTARVEGGARWADVDRETQVFGLAVPGGVVSTTGVAGLTLHGGMGYLRRKHGLSIDNLLSVDIVMADGQVRSVSAANDPDLFWAVRGAGSNFGVVTSFEFQLHPVGPLVTLCAVFYAQADAERVVRAWRDVVTMAPDELSSFAVFWSVPAEPPLFPSELHGTPVVIVNAVYAGGAEEGERAIQPLRELATPLIDLSGPLPYQEVQTLFDPFFPPGLLYYWKSLNLDHLDDAVIDEVCRLAAERPSERSDLMLWCQGGAIGRVAAEATAFGRRDAPFMLLFDSTWRNPEDSTRNIAWTRSAWSSMQQYSTGGGLYLNFPGLGEESAKLLRSAHGANYARLRALKATYDPTNLFRSNLNIPTTG
ncbi:MAG TPA: FAD-binding oxidoreductase [Thermomicrobiales bacterium]|nr:FAD-binding oxidoreductase [Thermomicrobiales bacterium]